MTDQRRLQELLIELREAAQPFTRERMADEYPGATHLMAVSQARRLREQADALDRRDAQIRRLREAVAAAQGIEAATAGETA